MHTGAKVRTLTNYGHCSGYHTVLFYTPLCRASSCPTFQPPPVTYYYIIHTQSDIPITSGEKSHIPTKPKGRRNLGLRQERVDLIKGLTPYPSILALLYEREYVLIQVSLKLLNFLS